jgi:ankyrin repeat protein/predicted aspartyl protease
VVVAVFGLIVTGQSDAASPATGDAAGPSGITKSDHTVQLAFGGDNLYARVQIHGQDAGWFLVNPGNPSIGVDTGLARRLELKMVAEGPIVAVEELRIGELQMPPHLAIAADISELKRQLGVVISGVLGGTFLQDRPYTMDFRAGTITFHDRDHFVPPAAPAVEEPIRIINSIPAVRGTVDARGGWFTLDTTYEIPVQASRVFTWLHPEMFRWARRPAEGVPSAQRFAVTRFESLDALGTHIPAVLGQYPILTTVGKFDMTKAGYPSGTIGGPILRDLRITFDYEQRRLWREHLPHETTEALLHRLTDPARKDLMQSTPLVEAIRLGRSDAAESLINQGADVNASDSPERTPLLLASRLGDLNLVKLLLSKGAKVNVLDSAGNPPIVWAAVTGNVEIMAALIARGAEKETLDAAVNWAAAGNRASVIDLLASNHANVNQLFGNGSTALSVAAWQGNTEAVRELLKRGASQVSLESPLARAAESGWDDIVRLLLDAHGNVDDLSAHGWSPLMEAAASGSMRTVRTLLAAGADTSKLSPEGKTAMEIAANSHELFCASIIQAADQNPRDRSLVHIKDGRDTALLMARRGENYLFLSASIDGHDAGSMLLDTGATGLVIDSKFAKELHLPVIASQATNKGVGVQQSFVKVGELAFNGVSIGPLICTTADLQGLGKAMGITNLRCLGMPFFGSPVTIDFAHATVEVSRGGRFHPPAGDPRIMYVCRSLPMVLATVNGSERNAFVLDSGNSGALAVTQPLALLHPEWLETTHPSRDSHMRVDGREMNIALHTAALDALGKQWRPVEMNIPLGFTRINPIFEPAGWVGSEILEDCRLTLDFGDQKVWSSSIPSNEKLESFLARIDTPASEDVLRTTPLIRAASAGRSDAVKELLSSGSRPDVADSSHVRPLEIACGRGDKGMVDLLLAAGAKAEAWDLARACEARSPEIVERLIRAGADVNPKDGEATPLMAAANAGDAKCAEMLLKAGADPRWRTADGTTAIAVAALSDSPAVLRKLLDAHGDPEGVRSNGTTPLILAAPDASTETLELLLTHGAKIDHQDDEGQTALMAAAARAEPKTVRFLLQHGADPTLKNKEGQTAFDLGLQRGWIWNAEVIYFASPK